MSSNVRPLGQAQAVALAPFPGPPPAHLLSLLRPNDGVLGDGLPQAPFIVRPNPARTLPPASDPAPAPILAPAPSPALAPFLAPMPVLDPAPVPDSVPAPAQPPPNAASKETKTGLANLVAERDIAVAALYAFRYHESLNQANPPAVDELLLRILDSPVKLGQSYAKFQQGKPNAVALRLLLARASPRYGYEQEPSHGIDKRGNPIFGRKCEAPGCEFRNADLRRHAEDHAKDPDFALCCPYKGCTTVVYCGRDSEMKNHCDDHQRKGEPLSAYLLQ